MGVRAAEAGRCTLKRRNRIDPRRIKSNRAYTIDELARTLGCHKNAVRGWLRQGLRPLEDGKRPLLIQGGTARGFLEARRKASKRKCQPDELFCLKCKQPRRAVPSTATFQATFGLRGMLSAACVECATQMFKCVSVSRLPTDCGLFEGEKLASGPTLKQAA